MVPRTTSTAERFIAEEVASPEETAELLGMSPKRAATLARWAAEALRDVDSTPRPAPVPAAKTIRRSAKKKPGKR